jgi:glycosyltransferase involved in cell wall biosynthesis
VSAATRDLFVTSATPTLAGGAALRTYGVVAALAREHPVDLVYKEFGSQPVAPEYEALDRLAIRKLIASRGWRRALAYARSRARGVPSEFARGVTPELIAAVQGVPADTRIIADGPVTAAALLPLARRRELIYLAHNVESGFRETSSRGDLVRFERTVLRTYAECWMVTRSDERAACVLAGREVRTRYVPNVVDVSLIAPVQPAGEGRALFIADFTYPPNREALAYLVEDVLPLAWQRRPDLRVSVVGRGISEPPGDDRVQTLGFVDELRSAYASADLVVVPLLQGGGSPLKFIEALAYGLPVVATDHAARLIEDGEAGTHFLSASGPREFVEAMERVLSEPPLGAALAAAGRKLVETSYSTQVLARLLAC